MNTHTTILDESIYINLDELSGICHVEKSLIIDMVNEGIIYPENMEPRSEWKFSGLMLRRIQITTRLMNDLQVNLAGAALAIDLMEQIQVLRQQLKF